MRVSRVTVLLVIAALLLFVPACNGGGGEPDPGPPPPGDTVVIKDIIPNPASPGATALVELTLDAVSTGTPITSRTKTYSATRGMLFESPPDFTLVLRGAAESEGESAIITKSSKVFWVSPAIPGAAEIKVEIGSVSFSKTITIGNSLATLSVSEDGEGNKVVTVSAMNVDDLFQAAFRLNYPTSKYTVKSIEKGDFLGSDTLFIGEHEKTPEGVVAVSITRKRGDGGVDGSGVLAEIVFATKEATPSRSTSLSAAFGLEYVTLHNSALVPMGVD